MLLSLFFLSYLCASMNISSIYCNPDWLFMYVYYLCIYKLIVLYPHQITALSEAPCPVQAQHCRQTRRFTAHPVRNKWKSCYPADWWGSALNSPASILHQLPPTADWLSLGEGCCFVSLLKLQRTNWKKGAKMLQKIKWTVVFSFL